MTRESATFAWILRVHRRNEAGKTRLDGVSLCDVISPSETGSNPCPGRPAPRLIQTRYNCIKLADDWQGADFLAYHKDGSGTLKVQLKARLALSKKYVGKSLYMAFPMYQEWYLIEHDAGSLGREAHQLASHKVMARGRTL